MEWINLEFKVFPVKNQKDIDEVMEQCSVKVRLAYEAREKEVLNNLENDIQKVIFLDWWHGGNLWKWNAEERTHDRAKRYWHVSDHDWDKANDYILETISLGMG